MIVTTWTEAVPALKIERLPNGNLRLECPDENSEGYTAIVDVHPLQLRLMAERLGMLREVSATDAAMLQSEREFGQRMRSQVDILQRRLLTIRERSVKLQKNFRQFADWDHADLSSEMMEINGLVDLLDLAVDDFEDDYEESDPKVSKDATPRSAAPPAASPPASVVQGDLLESAP